MLVALNKFLIVKSCGDNEKSPEEDTILLQSVMLKANYTFNARTYLTPAITTWPLNLHEH